MFTTGLLIICIQCIQASLVLSDGRVTRGLSMLRMGKRGYLPPLVLPSYDLPEEMSERQLVDEYDVPHYQDVRVVPPVPRLGDFGEYLNEIRRELASEPVYNTVHYSGRQKRSADITDEQVDGDVEAEQVLHNEKRSFPRYGLRDAENNMPFPRLGLYERDQPFPRLGLRSGFPRIGLRDNENPFPRLGLRESGDAIQTEVRAFPRYGLREVEDEKRAMSMLRMGKRADDEQAAEKRKMSMLRMGKRKMSMLRMGKRKDMSMLRMGRSMEGEDSKRAMSMLRMGRSQDGTLDDGTEEQKRAMSMLRMGKRNAMSMLRMGRSMDEDSTKRAMSMLRMGRGMSMLRMGRSNPELEAKEEVPDKRKMSMLRMGRSMGMLPMDSTEGETAVEGGEKRAMSMLRMGKKDNDQSALNES